MFSSLNGTCWGQFCVEGFSAHGDAKPIWEAGRLINRFFFYSLRNNSQDRWSQIDIKRKSCSLQNLKQAILRRVS